MFTQIMWKAAHNAAQCRCAAPLRTFCTEPNTKRGIPAAKCGLTTAQLRSTHRVHSEEQQCVAQCRCAAPQRTFCTEPNTKRTQCTCAPPSATAQLQSMVYSTISRTKTVASVYSEKVLQCTVRCFNPVQVPVPVLVLWTGTGTCMFIH